MVCRDKEAPMRIVHGIEVAWKNNKKEAEENKRKLRRKLLKWLGIEWPYKIDGHG